MPLLDYLSAGEEDQQSEIEAFLSRRWRAVTEEEPVLKAQTAGESSSWFDQEFSVLGHKVEGQDRIEVDFSFKVTGLDERVERTGEVISGMAKAWIDLYDNVEFTDVEVQLVTADR
jgi:hypothetical protein